MSGASFNRKFQLWKYDVAHGQLLFRASKQDIGAGRIDLLFSDVREIAVPVVMDIKRVVTLGERSFEIVHSAGRGKIDAGDALWAEDEGDYWEPSPVFGGAIARNTVVHRIGEAG